METGIHKISHKEYIADPCDVASLSRSTIKDLIYRTPRHAFCGHAKLSPNQEQEKEKKFDIGSAAHSIFLEGNDIAIFLDVDDWRTKAAQAAREEIYAIGKIPLLRKQHDGIMAMVEVAHESLLKSELACEIKSGDSELTYIWKEGDTYCRIRPDWVNKDRTVILDYKTTGVSAGPEEFARQIVSTGIDIQDAFYRRGVKKIDGADPDFVLMVQEIDAPYLCSFIRLDLQFQDMGEQKVKRGMQIWRECMLTGQWPAYSDRIYTVEPPSYALASWEYNKLKGGQ